MYRAAIAAALLAAAFFAGWVGNGWRLDAKIKAERIAAEQAHTAALEAARREDNRRIASLVENLNAASAQLDRALADRDRAAAASSSLQQRAETVAASCVARDASAPGAGPAAPAPGHLLADVLGRIDRAAGDLAAYADRLAVASRACERQYDALGR